MPSTPPAQGGMSAKRKHQAQDGEDGSPSKRQNSGQASSPLSSPLDSPILNLIHLSLATPPPLSPNESILSPIEPVSLNDDNEDIMLMPGEPDYELARQLKASLELGWKLGTLRYENWETVREARGLRVLLDWEDSYARRMRLFGKPEKDEEHKQVIKNAIQRQAQAEEVLAFSKIADRKPRKCRRWLRPSYYKI